ncbi:MAG: hypothetical protein IT495_12205 [Gammaproteobacteria bacterium]|nr:hypothetical protein [Gammaproteobacteria bacterium]
MPCATAGKATDADVLLRVVIAWVALLAVVPARGAAEPVDVYVFWAHGCPHCEDAMAWLEARERARGDLRTRRLEVTGDADARALFERAVRNLGVSEPAVPFIVVGDRHIIGWSGAAGTGAIVEAMLERCRDSTCPDLVAGQRTGAPAPPAALPSAAPVPASIHLPLVGELRLAQLSLPALTLVLGALDGFNPCAMWVLVFLIGLLLGLRDRTRMWLLGTVFIAGSAAVYFLFMAAWLNFLLFVGFVVWVRAAIAAVALGAGLYNLREFIRNPAGVCRVTAPAARRRLFERLRQAASQPRLVIALAGVLALAFAVNLVELVCSAGIPAVYTQILAFNDIAGWQYYAYLGGYVTVFMLDDLVVFVLAMKTLQIAGATGRYTRASHLVGAIVMTTIGLLLLVRPEWLLFG